MASLGPVHVTSCATTFRGPLVSLPCPVEQGIRKHPAPWKLGLFCMVSSSAPGKHDAGTTSRALRSLKVLNNSKLLNSARDVSFICLLHLPCEFAGSLGPLWPTRERAQQALSWRFRALTQICDLLSTEGVAVDVDIVDVAVPGIFAAVRVPPNPHVETVCRDGSGYGGRDVAPAVNVQCRRPAVVALFVGGVIRRGFERDVLRMDEGARGTHGAGQADVGYAGFRGTSGVM